MTPQQAAITTAELDQHCADCAKQLERAQAIYEASGCFTHAADVQIAKDRFYAAIRARNAARTAGDVLAIEVERGLV